MKASSIISWCLACTAWLNVAHSFCTFAFGSRNRDEIRSLLEEKSRRELQGISKQYGISGKLKSSVIIEEILNKLSADGGAKTNIEVEEPDYQRTANLDINDVEVPVELDESPLSGDLMQIMRSQGINIGDLVEFQRSMKETPNVDPSRPYRDLSPEQLAAKRQKQEMLKEQKRLMKQAASAQMETKVESEQLPQDGLVPEPAPSVATNAEPLQRAVEVRVIQQTHIDRRALGKDTERQRNNAAADQKLEKMLKALIAKKGYPAMYQATQLRLFQLDPNFNGVLKLLRKPHMAWAREKIEEMYQNTFHKI